MLLFGFIIRIYHNARSSECQITCDIILSNYMEINVYAFAYICMSFGSVLWLLL